MKTRLMLFILLIGQAQASINFECVNDPSSDHKTFVSGSVELTGETYSEDGETYPMVLGTVAVKTDYIRVDQKNITVSGIYDDGKISGIKNFSLMSEGAKEDFSLRAYFLPSKKNQGSGIKFYSFKDNLDLVCKEVK